MSEQTKPQASVTTTPMRIEIRCPYVRTQQPRDSHGPRLRDQISSAVFEHEQQCGRCDTTAAYKSGSRDFDPSAAHINEGSASAEVDRSERLVREAEDIEQDVAPGREQGAGEPPTEPNSND
jgi:hypothetical protein